MDFLDVKLWFLPIDTVLLSLSTNKLVYIIEKTQLDYTRVYIKFSDGIDIEVTMGDMCSYLGYYYVPLVRINQMAHSLDPSFTPGVVYTNAYNYKG